MYFVSYAIKTFFLYSSILFEFELISNRCKCMDAYVQEYISLPMIYPFYKT